MYHKYDKRVINNKEITTYKKDGKNCLYVKKKDKNTGKFKYVKLNKKTKGGDGLLEKYFKTHNYPFQSNSIDVNMFGHPSVKNIKHDENLLYTTYHSKGSGKK